MHVAFPVVCVDMLLARQRPLRFREPHARMPGVGKSKLDCDRQGPVFRQLSALRLMQIWMLLVLAGALLFHGEWCDVCEVLLLKHEVLKWIGSAGQTNALACWAELLAPLPCVKLPMENRL